jgi:hypothetical protein
MFASDRTTASTQPIRGEEALDGVGVPAEVMRLMHVMEAAAMLRELK